MGPSVHPSRATLFARIVRIDLILLIIYFISLVIGIWHALPNTDVVRDEWAYALGVLDTWDARTLVPQVPYTYSISFYASYILQSIIRLFFFENSPELMRSFAGHSIWVLHLVPRAVSAVCALVMLGLFLKLGRVYEVSMGQRVAAAILVFTNIIFVTMAHTGKHWIMSIFLFFLSFYFFAKAIHRRDEARNAPWFKSPILCSVLTAFISITNFPLNALALIHVAVLAYIFKKDTRIVQLIIGASIFGLCIAGGLFLMNQHGTTGLEQYKIGIIDSVSNIPVMFLYFLVPGVFLLMPCTLLALLSTKSIRHTLMFWIVCTHIALYSCLLGALTQWAAEDAAIYWRYLTYITFLAGLLLLFVRVRHIAFLFLWAGIGIVFFIKLLYLLAAPTTYNLLSSYITNVDLRNTLVVNNHVVELDLFWPHPIPNSFTYMDVRRARVTDADVPSAISKVVDTVISNGTVEPKQVYWIDDHKLPNPIFSAQSGAKTYYASVDDGLGPYTPKFLTLSRLGRPLFVYAYIKN